MGFFLVDWQIQDCRPLSERFQLSPVHLFVPLMYTLVINNWAFLGIWVSKIICFAKHTLDFFFIASNDCQKRECDQRDQIFLTSVILIDSLFWITFTISLKPQFYRFNWWHAVLKELEWWGCAKQVKYLQHRHLLSFPGHHFTDTRVKNSKQILLPIF